MKTIKINNSSEIPIDYTGIVEWEDGQVWWFKNGKWHREDGPAKIWLNRIKSWYLDGKYIWNSSFDKIDLRNKIMLSKEQYPEYSTVQVWKHIDENGIREQIIVPGMEEFIFE